MHVSLMVPAPFETLSGGYAYDRRMVAGLRAAGHTVEVMELPGRHPLANDAARNAACAAWDALAIGTRPVIDGLALPAFVGMDDALTGRATVGLIHHPTALETGFAYNSVTKKRSYCMIPNRMAVTPFHVWKSLLDKAGYKTSDIPKTWDAFLDFFPQVAEKLRAQGKRNVYAYSIMISAVGFDAIGHFDHLMIAYGGKDLFTPDGKVHTDDPKVREAAVKVVTKLATAFKSGFMPSAIQNWNDNDDNNAFHSKLLVMDLDGTISTEVALWKDKDEYNDILTLGLPLSDDGKPVAGVMGTQALVVPKGAPNITVAKDFLKYSIEPTVLAALLKAGLGRRLPPMTSIVENDKAYWLDPKNEPLAAYTQQGIYGPTIAPYEVFNPARAQVSTEHVFPLAILDVINKGVTPDVAIDAAFKRCETIFAQYPIQES